MTTPALSTSPARVRPSLRPPASPVQSLSSTSWATMALPTPSPTSTSPRIGKARHLATSTRPRCLAMVTSILTVSSMATLTSRTARARTALGRAPHPSSMMTSASLTASPGNLLDTPTSDSSSSQSPSKFSCNAISRSESWQLSRRLKSRPRPAQPRWKLAVRLTKITAAIDTLNRDAQ